MHESKRLRRTPKCTTSSHKKLNNSVKGILSVVWLTGGWANHSDFVTQIKEKAKECCACASSGDKDCKPTTFVSNGSYWEIMVEVSLGFPSHRACLGRLWEIFLDLGGISIYTIIYRSCLSLKAREAACKIMSIWLGNWGLGCVGTSAVKYPIERSREKYKNHDRWFGLKRSEQKVGDLIQG